MLLHLEIDLQYYSSCGYKSCWANSYAKKFFKILNYVYFDKLGFGSMRLEELILKSIKMFICVHENTNL